jgi:transcription antitermination factor NusG
MSYVIGYVHNGLESLFRDQALNRYGIDTYIPMAPFVRAPAVGKHSAVIQDAPLFRNYVFINTRPGWENVYRLATLDHILTMDEEPYILSDQDVETLKVREGLREVLGAEKQNLRIVPGIMVKVTSGFFNGLIGMTLPGTRGKWVHLVLGGEPQRLPRCIVEIV